MSDVELDAGGNKRPGRNGCHRRMLTSVQRIVVVQLQIKLA